MSPEPGPSLVRSLLVDVGGAAYAHVELHRPEAMNAWTAAMGRELLAVLRGHAEDPQVRAVLVTGSGRCFSAGADVKDPRESLPNGDPDLSTRLLEVYNQIVLTVRRMPKPVVAAVHGATAGLGVSLALACDLVLAADDAYFLLAFVRIAVMPDAGAATFLVERCGTARTMELTMLGDRLPAQTALEWGVVNAVHERAALPGAAHALAARLATGPTVALANIKRSVLAAGTTDLETELVAQATAQQSHASTADYAEGVRAFADKRPATFLGR